MDNECSKCIQNYLEEKETRRHHVAPHAHRVNVAKPAAKKAKYHLIAALATLDWGCPIQLWSKMLKQVQDTLNMFRTSRNDTTKTAYQELEGDFDWNTTPMAPLGTKGSVYIHPDNRNMFAPHCNEGFTVGRAPHHYRLLEFYIPATRGYRLSGTYRLYPQHCRMPVTTEEDKTVEAAKELLAETKKEIPPATREKNTMAENNKEVTSLPVPRRSEGGVVGTNEGGRQQRVIKQPHMPANAEISSKNTSTQDKTQHACHRPHGDRACAARRRSEADANLHAQR